MTINEAVKALREKLGLSQQAFAVRSGVSISAVQKYESDREPDFRSAVSFLRLAQEAPKEILEDADRAVLEECFRHAIHDASENAYTPGALQGAIPYRSLEEWRRMRAVQWVLQDGRFKHLLPHLDEVLDPVYNHMKGLGVKRMKKAKGLFARLDAYESERRKREKEEK